MDGRRWDPLDAGRNAANLHGFGRWDGGEGKGAQARSAKEFAKLKFVAAT
jgi:hypothetical protein